MKLRLGQSPRQQQPTETSRSAPERKEEKKSGWSWFFSRTKSAKETEKEYVARGREKYLLSKSAPCILDRKEAKKELNIDVEGELRKRLQAVYEDSFGDSSSGIFEFLDFFSLDQYADDTFARSLAEYQKPLPKGERKPSLKEVIAQELTADSNSILRDIAEAAHFVDKASRNLKLTTYQKEILVSAVIDNVRSEKGERIFGSQDDSAKKRRSVIKQSAYSLADAIAEKTNILNENAAVELLARVFHDPEALKATLSTKQSNQDVVEKEVPTELREILADQLDRAYATLLDDRLLQSRIALNLLGTHPAAEKQTFDPEIIAGILKADPSFGERILTCKEADLIGINDLVATYNESVVEVSRTLEKEKAIISEARRTFLGEHASDALPLSSQSPFTNNSPSTAVQAKVTGLVTRSQREAPSSGVWSDGPPGRHVFDEGGKIWVGPSRDALATEGKNACNRYKFILKYPDGKTIILEKGDLETIVSFLKGNVSKRNTEEETEQATQLTIDSVFAITNQQTIYNLLTAKGELFEKAFSEEPGFYICPSIQGEGITFTISFGAEKDHYIISSSVSTNNAQTLQYNSNQGQDTLLPYARISPITGDPDIDPRVPIGSASVVATSELAVTTTTPTYTHLDTSGTFEIIPRTQQIDATRV